MRTNAVQFRPGLVPTLLTLLLFPVLVSLGFWQLDRAEQKRELLAAMVQGDEAPPVNLNLVQPEYDAVRYRRARAQGRLDRSRIFLLDNQFRDGRPGYLILVPLRLAGSKSAILVEQGWIPMRPDRTRPEVPAMEPGQVTVTGRVDTGPSIGLRLGAPGEAEPNWPERVQYLDFEYLQQRVPYPLLNFLLRTDEAGASVTARAELLSPQTHVGYAVQWFALALTLLVIYVAVNFRRRPDAGSNGE